ncbi:MAG: D-sedoheptulose 7-phosphate isomerase [Proteobacteria bacterium]|nr:D-sedoheptulose 7-phosphate isomerase [Pseudomonadota bacterium]
MEKGGVRKRNGTRAIEKEGHLSDIIQRGLEEHLELFRSLPSLAKEIERAASLICEALRSGRKLMLCGNGGSAADSQHIAAEMAGRFVKDRRPLAAVALSTDTSTMTCIANDYTFDEVFSRQVAGLGVRGDCLLAISTSGNSRNVIRAVQTARTAGVVAIGLLGKSGGALRDICDVPIVVPSQTTARIQEAHIFIGHTLCALIEEALGLA